MDDSQLTLLDRCIIIATKAHSGQIDNLGEPYILHCLRVMCDPSLSSVTERCVAVLHDVMEDCTDTVEMLKLPDHIVSSCRILTREKHISYASYITRIKSSNDIVAIEVKLADLKDNLSNRRSLGRTDEMTNRYVEAQKTLYMSNG